MEAKDVNYCVILAGGIGSRLWPVSRKELPKQFLDWFGTGRTLLQQTYDRFRKIIDAKHIFIVTNEHYADLVREQLPDVAQDRILKEPIRRNTLPSVAWATTCISHLCPHGNVIVSPADQLILEENNFDNDVLKGLDFVGHSDCLLTMGVKPTRPDTGYGYIQAHENMEEGAFARVKSFTEKPALDFARVFMESGEFYWNTGLYLYNVRTMMKAIHDLVPDYRDSLTEAIGLSLPGNGTILATHANRIRLFQNAAKLVVENAFKYYEEGDESVLPKSIATRQAFLNAMTLDIAMGGSSNTVLHLLAVANEAGVDFKMADIDALSRKVPCLCKLAPNTQKYSIQECNRAGGILNILGELAKAGLLDTSCRRVNGRTLGEDIAKYSITSGQVDDEAQRIYSSAPGGVFSNKMGSQSKVYDTLDTDRATGCIRDVEHAYSKDGGLAVLFGNIAQDGCVVKTAGVDESIWHFSGPAKVFDSQEDACEGILNGSVVSGDVVVITHEGPKGGPGMQEMLYPTSYLKSRHLGKECALITDGRFSGGTSGLSIGHISPEAAAGGNIGKIVDGDIIEIDIPNRSINVKLSEAELAARPQRPMTRKRVVPKSLKAYASMVSSADKGGVRMID